MHYFHMFVEAIGWVVLVVGVVAAGIIWWVGNTDSNPFE